MSVISFLIRQYVPIAKNVDKRDIVQKEKFFPWKKFFPFDMSVRQMSREDNQ